MNIEQRLHYLNAFGIPEFLYNTQIIKNAIPKINTQCLVIETQNLSSFCRAGKSQVFLLKMLETIGIQADDIQCINIHSNELIDILKQYEAKTVLLMSPDLKPSSKSHFIAHHPSEIIINESLKRKTWETLKKLKQCLK